MVKPNIGNDKGGMFEGRNKYILGHLVVTTVKDFQMLVKLPVAVEFCITFATVVISPRVGFNRVHRQWVVCMFKLYTPVHNSSQKQRSPNIEVVVSRHVLDKQNIPA